MNDEIVVMHDINWWKKQDQFADFTKRDRVRSTFYV